MFSQCTAQLAVAERETPGKNDDCIVAAAAVQLSTTADYWPWIWSEACRRVDLKRLMQLLPIVVVGDKLLLNH
jgi:hypothetical protein